MGNITKGLTLVIAAIAITNSGCGNRDSSAETQCSDLRKITDPAALAALKEKCGRGGPEFKPTPKDHVR